MATALRDEPKNVAFDRSRLWHRTAPRRLVEKWEAGGADRQWTVWQKHLARRKRPRRPPFLAGKRPPILWGWLGNSKRSELADFVDNLAERAVYLTEPLDRFSEPCRALEAVATAYALPDLAAELPADAWWTLADVLRDLARDAQSAPIDLTADAQQTVRHQLLAGELPVALSYLLPELASLERLGKPARQALSESLVAVTDGRGAPHGRLLSEFGPLLACWTRARWLGKRLKQACWSRAAETQYEWLVRRALQLADGSQRFLLSGDREDTDSRGLRELLATAIELAGDKADCAAAAAAVSRSIVPERAKFSERDLPKAPLHSEWASAAVLTSGWSKSAPRLAISYADDPLALELRVGGRQILAGNVAMETTSDGRPVTPIGDWEEICWQSDEDCDYLELGIDLADGLALERQILLAKEDSVFYLADVVLADDRTPHQLRHSLRFPLGRDTEWRPEKETRDGVLVVGKQRIAVLPLALSEWRSDPRGGRLECDNGALTLTQEATGAALACPLMFDLKSTRCQHERTWRQLTVAESLRVVSRDVAVGYRAQSGRDQWMFYRSLAPAGNRTLLGQNLSSEFLAGRFVTTGECDEWIEIEPNP